MILEIRIILNKLKYLHKVVMLIASRLLQEKICDICNFDFFAKWYRII
jgi:hypothetical protein